MRSRRLALMAAAIVLAVGVAPADAKSRPQETRRWTTATTVSGGWQGTPPVVPTSVDLTTSTISVVGQYTLHGSWTGVVYFSSDDVRVDTTNGDYTFSTEATFAGTWVPGNAVGTVTWRETVAGNVITGETKAAIEITGGTGDATFQCSSGELMWVGYANPATSFGGYTGTWQHGCPAS